MREGGRGEEMNGSRRERGGDKWERGGDKWGREMCGRRGGIGGGEEM